MKIYTVTSLVNGFFEETSSYTDAHVAQERFHSKRHMVMSALDHNEHVETDTDQAFITYQGMHPSYQLVLTEGSLHTSTTTS